MLKSGVRSRFRQWVPMKQDQYFVVVLQQGHPLDTCINSRARAHWSVHLVVSYTVT